MDHQGQGGQDTLRRSRAASPNRISKDDISNPTRTHGPLFSTGDTLDSDEEDNLQALTVNEQREKVCCCEVRRTE